MESDVSRRILAYTWVVVGLAVLQLIWIGVARYSTGQPQSRVASKVQTPYPGAAGAAVRITQFYASPGTLPKGERAVICYGVENARSVRIEPPVETLKPALTRCFWIEPERDTTYRLFAAGADGAEVTESLTVRVTPAPPAILFVALSGREVSRDSPLTLCYGVKNVTSARLEPLGMPLAASERMCIRIFPPTTLQYTLVAYGEGGRTDRERFRIRVK